MDTDKIDKIFDEFEEKIAKAKCNFGDNEMINFYLANEGRKIALYEAKEAFYEILNATLYDIEGTVLKNGSVDICRDETINKIKELLNVV